ncbi:Beta-ketoacyl synthase [Metarhizium album ARSEF 1941]|uniref:Beta-ketoacyl synthase n=1 Tax=Metarhizium album (strain ARSEF 1941) TaxID=1081103 RepID=A0A0B2WLJ5_METAS|nr:Beta-ketoacyl synthase [Metarhizium album ARSEF 1941]KHN94788.1 Beta-ketoacyl synthase [Metarhizium album ARSEF 1941]
MINHQLSAMEVMDVFRDAIVIETGYDIGKSDFNTDFSDLGLDSLAAIGVVNIVTNRTGIELPASLFRDCKTFSDLSERLGQNHAINGLAPAAQRLSSQARQRVRDAFLELRKHERQFAEDAGFANFWTTVYPAERRLVLSFVYEAFADLGCPLDEIHAGETVTCPRGVLEKHRRVFDGAIFEILKDGGIVSETRAGHIRTSSPIDKTPSIEIYSKIVQDHPLYAKVHQLLHVTGSQFAECLGGKADPIKLLFGKNKDLLQHFYTKAPMSLAASMHLAALVKRIYASQAFKEGERVEILEVGAGLGGTTGLVLDALVEANVPFRYVFTDISSSFFGAAKSRYCDIAPCSMEYLVLDIEKEPPESLRRRFDLVISTNCIHATRNLAASCSNVQALLRPGGFFALVEFTTRFYWLDLVFGLLDGWWLFEDGRQHCTVSEAVWKTSLQHAGFSEVLWTDAELSEKPNPQLLVACTG